MPIPATANAVVAGLKNFFQKKAKTADHLREFLPVGSEERFQAAANKTPLRKEDALMTDIRECTQGQANTTDEELIGVLTAISVTSKRLAGKLIRLSQAKNASEGGSKHEALRSQSGHRIHR